MNTILAALTPAVPPVAEKNIPPSKIDEDKTAKKQNAQDNDGDQEQKKASAFAAFLNAQMMQQDTSKNQPKKIISDNNDNNNSGDTRENTSSDAAASDNQPIVENITTTSQAASQQTSPFVFKAVAVSSDEMTKNNIVPKEIKNTENTENTENTKQGQAAQTTQATQATQATENNLSHANNVPAENTENIKNAKDIKAYKDIKNVDTATRSNATVVKKPGDKASVMIKAKTDNAAGYRVQQTTRDAPTSSADFSGEKQKFTKNDDITFIEKQKQFLNIKRDQSAQAAEAASEKMAEENNSDIRFQSVVTDASTTAKSMESAVSVREVPELILHQLSQGHSNIVFHLNPKNLGAVRVQINTASKNPTVNIIADKQEGYRELQTQLRSLVRDIQQQFSGCSVNLVLAQNNSVSTVVVAEMKNDRQIQKQTDIKMSKLQTKRQKS